jgi:hypothetical protein
LIEIKKKNNLVLNNGLLLVKIHLAFNIISSSALLNLKKKRYHHSILPISISIYLFKKMPNSYYTSIRKKTKTKPYSEPRPFPTLEVRPFKACQIWSKLTAQSQKTEDLKQIFEKYSKK